MNAFVPVPTTSIRKAILDDPGERARIDAFLAGRSDAQPFYRPEWSLAVERGCRQRAHYLLAEDGAGALAGLLPLTEMRSLLFGSALVSTGFGVGGGTLAANDRAAAALADAAWALAGKLGCPSVELRGGPAPEGWQVREGTYANFARPLESDDDAILKAIPRKQRAEVRRAQGLGLNVSVGRDLDAHYRVYSESVRNLGTPVFPRSLFAAMLDEFGSDADILTIRKGTQPIASVLSLYHAGTVYPYWGGGTAEARGLRANELMYFELMRHAAARGCTRFDFGRSKLGTGAYSFKKNWGFDPQPLAYAVKSSQPGVHREINPLSPRYRLQVAAWRKLPLGVANLVGPLLARGLG
jgi:FemAB-related protein (PEP-CTERM system-associated)